ncbi:MAG: response regulator [Caldilineaceae bacterium]|nr:response regulator [Caldilineaceae bacterium]
MKKTEESNQEIEALRRRMSLFYEAIQRINESLDFENVLQEVVDSARELTGARYGVIVSLDSAGQREEGLITSGMTCEERKRLVATPDSLQFFEYLKSLPGPLRISDFSALIRGLGLPDVQTVPAEAFLSAPIRYRREGIGNIFLARGMEGQEFTQEDEETLVMFAAQAAFVISNARRYREEQRARAGLQTLIDTSPVGVAVFDARTGELGPVNREGHRIVEAVRSPGQTDEELLEIITFRREDGQEISLEQLPLAQALGGSETLRAEEMVLSVPDGRSITILINATPIRTETDEVESMVVTLQDMTPLKDLERMRAEFLGMVSHELRAPLTSIKGSADTLLESFTALDPVEMVQFIRIIKTQAERMRDLISELLDVAGIETGTLSVAPVPVQVSTLVDEARNTFLSGGGRDNLAIDIEPNLPWAMADRRRIVQVLGNLFANASRYSTGSSPIEVKAAHDDRFVVISVADKGRGISSNLLPLLFRKFSRDSDEDNEGSSGLGLAICKGIVEAHGGRIWAESDGTGMGSKFTFTLPTTGAPSAGAERELHAMPNGARRAGLDKAHILVVDDDPMTLRYVRDTLAKGGYTPVVTADPEDALRIVEEKPIRLVLLDLMMPGIDGIELMRNILDIVEVPVIFLSAYGRDEIIARALESGAADYMVKPFSPTELTARVGAALRRRLAPVRGTDSEQFVLGELTINYGERHVAVAGRPVHLTATEYKLLTELSVNSGRVLTHEQLLRKVWGLPSSSRSSAIRTFVRRLRSKLGDNSTGPKYIMAVPRVGYRMPKGENRRLSGGSR